MEERITLGGGCFWCLEAIFLQIDGVIRVIPGYSGGHLKNPTYEQVCSNTTGHAEVVDITFNNNVISLEDILRIFFFIHDPTTPNRQGNDIGSQYRSIILYHTQDQKEKILNYIKKLPQEDFYKNYENKEITTEIKKFEEFYKAEDYHHNYYKNNPNNPYCKFVISPKIEKFKKKFKNNVIK
jgi:peptide-methionine (S)-S-oxide reductase